MLPKSDDLNQLQVQLLVFVKFGLATPYDLMSQAGMSVGLTSPALKRLEEAGLLTCTLGARKSMRYAITEKGDELLGIALKSGRPTHWRLGRYESFESAPRAILLAWASFGMEEASRCVDQASEELRFQAQQKEGDAEQLRLAMHRLESTLFQENADANKGELMATAYRWMKAASDAALLRLQVEAMKAFGPLLQELPPTPKIVGKVNKC